jgi:hypothetical protein
MVAQKRKRDQKYPAMRTTSIAEGFGAQDNNKVYLN